jgi:hypothetical protein
MPQSAAEIFFKLQFFALPEIASFIRLAFFAFLAFPCLRSSSRRLSAAFVESNDGRATIMRWE